MRTSGGSIPVLLSLLLSLLPLLAPFAAGDHTDCASLSCLHDSPCLTTVSNGNQTPRPAHARCLCRGYWAGPRCQYRIHVTAGRVTSHAVILKVTMEDPLTSSADSVPSAGVATSSSTGHQSGDVDVSVPESTRPNAHQSYLSSSNAKVRQQLVSEATFQMNYTITYWSNSSARTCRLLQEVTSLSPRILGLQPNSLYLFCVESGSLDSCAPSASDVTSEDTNCVKVVTPEASDLDIDLDPVPEPQAGSSQDVPTVVVVTVVTALLVVVVLAAVLLFRWFNLVTVRQFCTLCCTRDKEAASFQRFLRDNSSHGLGSDQQHQQQDFAYYSATAMPLPPAVDFPPPSPDLETHRNEGRRARVPVTRNSVRVTLEPVMEDTGDVMETSLMVPGHEGYGLDFHPSDVTEVSPMMAACDDGETSLTMPYPDDVRGLTLMMPSSGGVTVLPSTYTSPVMRHDMIT